VNRKRLHITSDFGGAFDLQHDQRSAARGGRVLPRCTTAQAADPTAICANGQIQVFQSIDRNDYKAMLVKLDKRFSNRYQFTASYALSSLTGFATGEDLDALFKYHVPLGADARHRFTFSGIANLPWGIQGSLIAVYASKGPFNANVPGTVDINGDGNGSDTLPGLKINDLGRGTGRSDLFLLVSQYNANVAKPSNGLIRPLVVPANFDFGDNFQSHDLRFSKEIRFKERYAIQGIFEIFNAFNISNLGGYSTTLDQGSFDSAGNVVAPGNFNFARPTVRAGQQFGTGGPRAIQFAARFTF